VLDSLYMWVYVLFLDGDADSVAGPTVIFVLLFVSWANLYIHVTGEASKQIHEYKLKLQKAEQDIATLEGTVSQVHARPYK
jgi:hypothetical protein